MLADFDNDGNLDLAVVNGRVSARATPVDWSLGPFWSRYGDRNQLFAGDGHGRFHDISAQNNSFSGYYNVARGLVRGDVFGDGAGFAGYDDRRAGSALPQRRAETRPLAIGTRLQSRVKRDALGAEVRVKAGGERESSGCTRPKAIYAAANHAPFRTWLVRRSEIHRNLMAGWSARDLSRRPCRSTDRIAQRGGTADAEMKRHQGCSFTSGGRFMALFSRNSAKSRVYADRVAGGDRHHRHSHRPPAARHSESA